VTRDLLGDECTETEERVLAVYAQLKWLAADPELAPNVAANVRAALALVHQAVTGLALEYEHLSDLGI